MVVILAAPWIGLLLYYLMPRRLQLRRLRRLRVRGARLREVRPRARGGGEPKAERRGLAALLAGGDGSGLVPGNAVVWLPSGEDFYARAERAIRGATRHVHCTVYIFRPDRAGLRFLSLLADAARAGVTVRLLYDSLGSFGLKARHLAELRAAGGRAEAFLPLLWKRRPFTMNLRNHRKLLVVDGEVGFTGGRNVGDEYFTDRLGQQRRWLDAMIELRGPAVDRLQDVFIEDWCTATEEVLSDTFVGAPAQPGDTAVGVVCSGPDRDESDLWFAVVQAIGEAVHSVELSSPYLVPPPVLLYALKLASARGVRVRVYTNGPAAEAWVLYHAQRSYYRAMLAAEIEIYETVREYNHAKLLVVDARTVVVGSANMDLRSANLNFELAAVALDASALAADVLATIERRRVDFRRITNADLPVRPWSRAIDGLCGLFSPLL
jgi:cardiolipin synthase